MKSPRLRLSLAGLVQLDRNADCVSGTFSCCHAVWCFVTFVWQCLMQLTRRNAELETTQRRSYSTTVSMTIKGRMSLIWFFMKANNKICCRHDLRRLLSSFSIWFDVRSQTLLPISISRRTYEISQSLCVDVCELAGHACMPAVSCFWVCNRNSCCELLERRRLRTENCRLCETCVQVGDEGQSRDAGEYRQAEQRWRRQSKWVLWRRRLRQV